MSKVNKKSVAWDVFNEKEVDLPQPRNYLSFHDLQRLPEFRLALMREDLSSFEKLLYENGADIDKGYYVRKCSHRPRTSNEIYDGFRVEFKERTDAEWLASGAASLDAHIHASEDNSLRYELKSLNPRFYSDEPYEDEREVGVLSGLY